MYLIDRGWSLSDIQSLPLSVAEEIAISLKEGIYGPMREYLTSYNTLTYQHLNLHKHAKRIPPEPTFDKIYPQVTEHFKWIDDSTYIRTARTRVFDKLMRRKEEYAEGYSGGRTEGARTDSTGPS